MPTAQEYGSKSTPGPTSRTQIVDPSEVAAMPGIRDRWDELARTSPHSLAFHQSPAWWDYLLETLDGEQAALAVVLAADGSHEGFVPVHTQNYVLDYSIRSRQLHASHLRVVKVLGNEPLVVNNESIYYELFRSILSTFIDCDGILLEWLPHGGACWNAIFGSRDLCRGLLAYRPLRTHVCHFVTVPDTFDHYLAKFKAKTRGNLRRQLKRFREHSGGRLDCVRIEHEDDVPGFLEAGAALTLQSRVYRNTGWQVLTSSPEMVRQYVRFARQGVLRSYLLRCGDEYCAFVRGYQYGGTFYYSFIGFDERYAAFSPGTSLLFLLLEDLCRHRPPKRVNFYNGPAKG
jgi:CelD/BcsL family acetyltransferase involved in cellulose biosynthesis